MTDDDSNESRFDRVERILEDISPSSIDWEETMRIVAANEETIKRYERERPARQAKHKQKIAELQAMSEQLRQQNEESIRLHEEWKQRHEEWKQRNKL